MTSRKYRSTNRDIYCGFDDSNHASQNPKSEIIVGVFSENRDDFKSERRSSRRDIVAVEDYVSSSDRSYIFALLPKDKGFNRHFNLPLVAPYFVSEYLGRNPGDIGPTSITLGFDGVIRKMWKDVLKEDFYEGYGLDVGIEYFTGKNKHICSLPVWSADVIANYIFGLPLARISQMGEMFNIDSRDLSDRLKLFT